jgi:hypothetical protein
MIKNIGMHLFWNFPAIFFHAVLKSERAGSHLARSHHTLFLSGTASGALVPALSFWLSPVKNHAIY